MRRFLKFLPLLFAAVAATALWSCGDDDDKPVPANDLPAAARSFLATYFPETGIYSVEKDREGYDVSLSDGHTVDFNLSGEWTDVEAPAGQTIPAGFYPAPIDAYVSANF
ncbi:MAG: PepSY-like domain-containing protein, partial [Duncaniella sp.]|nr:PepSY-like domain-containing protein [Duncaniella sp.]